MRFVILRSLITSINVEDAALVKSLRLLMGVWTGTALLENSLETLSTLEVLFAMQSIISTSRWLVWNHAHSCDQGDIFSVHCYNLYNREKRRHPKYFSVKE